VSLLLPGMYVATDSPLHRLDPRVKMGAALLLMVLPFSAQGWASYGMIAAFVGVLVFLAKAPLRALLGTLRTVVWVGLFMFVFYFFTTPGRPVFTIGSVSVTWEGLAAGGSQIFRLSLLVLIGSLLTYTTSPSQLSHGFEAMLSPLAKLGLPIRELAMVLTISLRFVPTLAAEIDGITKAQAARGAHIGSGNLWQRARGWPSLFVPVFVSAFRRADELAIAMEARGFRGAQARTRLTQLRLSRGDLIAVLVLLLVSAAVIGVDQLL